jgi:hypothetical protein
MSDQPTPPARRTPLEQADEAIDLARAAFANGNPVYGIAMLRLAAQLIHLAADLEPLL